MVPEIVKEFKAFIEEYKVLGITVAFIMGAATTNLVQSLVNNIIMPILNPILSTAGAWEEASFSFGSIVIKYGAFLSSFLNFFILALVVFLAVKKILKK